MTASRARENPVALIMAQTRFALLDRADKLRPNAGIYQVKQWHM